MGQVDKKFKNQLFKVAIDYIYKEHLVESQGELAEKIGISSSALSRIMNDKKFVGDDTLRKMNEAFGSIFNMAYFRGEDPHCMLIEDLLYYQQHPEERLVFEKPKSITPQFPTTSDMSILIEKAVEKATAYADKYIATLEKQVADKDREIERLEKEQDAKDEEIKRLQAIIHELETENSFIIKNDPLKDYPYPVGTAEPGIEKDHVRV